MCWPAASLSGMGTVVQQTARPSSGQWTQLQKSSVPLSPPSWLFCLHDAPVKAIVSWRTLPILPTVSSSSYHQEDGTRSSEPAPPDCLTAFSLRLWEPWTQLTPPLSETPYKPPTSWNVDHLTPPNLTTSHKKLSNIFVQFKVCYTQVSGPVQTNCSNTLSSIFIRHFHTLLCVHNPTKYSICNICINICFSFCTCTVFVRHSLHKYPLGGLLWKELKRRPRS